MSQVRCNEILYPIKFACNTTLRRESSLRRSADGFASHEDQMTSRFLECVNRQISKRMCSLVHLKQGQYSIYGQKRRISQLRITMGYGLGDENNLRKSECSGYLESRPSGSVNEVHFQKLSEEWEQLLHNCVFTLRSGSMCQI